MKPIRVRGPLATAGIALLLSVCLATAGHAQQQSEGPNTAGAITNDPAGGIPAWTSPADATASDNTYAQAVPGGGATQYLSATNYNFNIPSPALIDGIEVNIERRSAFGTIKDSKLRIIKGGVVGATERGDLVSTWPTVDTPKTYGSNADLWGETWTAADINAAGFGVALSVTDSLDAAFVDAMTIKVYYSLCQPAPQGLCRTATKSLLLVKNNSDNAKDKFIFKWIKGMSTDQTEFGNPTVVNGAVYATCVYENNALSFSMVVPASTTLWTPIGAKGYKYKDLTGTSFGVQKIIVKGSDDNKAKILVKGRGSLLPDPIPPALTLPVKVQVINSDSGLCWEATFDVPNIKKNTPDLFKGKN